MTNIDFDKCDESLIFKSYAKISIVFWLLLIISLGGSDVGIRRGFYWLLGVYVVMTLLGLFASIGMGLVAMAGAR